MLHRTWISSSEWHDTECPYSGIGLESSILFAQEGAHVLLADVNEEAAKKGAALITDRYPNVKATAVKVDVSKESDIKAVVDTAVKEFGRLDIMVSLIWMSRLTSY